MSLPTAAQEIGIGAGAATFLGDLGGNVGIGRGFLKDFQPSALHPSVSVWAGQRIGRVILSAGFLRTTLSGDDRSVRPAGGAEESRLIRGFVFSTPVSELTLAARVFAGPWFLTGGCGAMAFRRSGQVERRYGAVQPLLVYGGGVRFAIGEDLHLQAEAGGRKLFTDYVDDVSLRGDPKDKDSYVTARVSVVCSGWFRRDVLGCPKWR